MSPEQEFAFARKASGLVRGLSFWDAFGMGIAYITPIYGCWYVVTTGLTFYPRANLLITVALSLVTVGWASPMVWGLLSGTMPRSGGEYIYNSRIIHPAIAMGASFTQVCALFYWNVFNAHNFAVPSAALLGQFFGWTGFTNYVTSKAGGLVFSLICIGVGLLCVVFGMKLFHKLTFFVIAVITGGVVILNLALTFTTKAAFIDHWNAEAAKYNSLSYDAFIKAAGDAAGSAMPTSWNWSDSFGATMAVFTLFVWTFCIAYVSGEVKRPDKTMIKSQLPAVWVPVALFVWMLIAYTYVVDFDFLRAAAYQDFTGAVEGYNLPYSSSYMSLTYVASGGNWFVGVTSSVTFMVNNIWMLTVSILIIQRAFFAWGMDRMGPRWFTNVSARRGAPVQMYILATVISMVLMVAYWYVFPSLLAGLVASGMQLVSVFALTSISAILLPYRKKVANIWSASPFSRWKILGVPVLTISGVVYLCYIVVLLYYAFFSEKTRDVTGKNLGLFVGTWIVGMCWYFAWRYHGKSQGVDVGITYGQLPPE
jgi:basic amino acid/polyamine antiporter, APA family